MLGLESGQARTVMLGHESGQERTVRPWFISQGMLAKLFLGELCRVHFSRMMQFQILALWPKRVRELAVHYSGKFIQA